MLFRSQEGTSSASNLGWTNLFHLPIRSLKMAPKFLLGLAILFLGSVSSIPLPTWSGGSTASEGTPDVSNDNAAPTEQTGDYQGYGDRKKRSILGKAGLGERQVSTNCRTVVAVNVNDPWMCSQIKQGDLLDFDPIASPTYGQEVDTHDDDYYGYDDEEHASHTGNGNSHSGGHYNEVNLADAPGRCRYDAAMARVNPNAACLCVATRKNCEYGRDGCCWHENRKTGFSECISKAEKFYNQLYELLRRRGKKSFAKIGRASCRERV